MLTAYQYVSRPQTVPAGEETVTTWLPVDQDGRVFHLAECDLEAGPPCGQEQDHREGIVGRELWSIVGEGGKSVCS